MELGSTLCKYLSPTRINIFQYFNSDSRILSDEKNIFYIPFSAVIIGNINCEPLRQVRKLAKNDF